MSDMLANGQKRHQRPGPGKRQYLGYDTAKPPTEAEIAEQTEEQREVAPLWTPEQIREETRNVRVDISFEDVARIRAQIEMVQECAKVVIGIAKQHDLGSTQQRVRMRQEWDSLRRALARFNGRKPRFDTYKP